MQVIDYDKLVQPRFEKARELLIENAVTEATEAAIRGVRERFQAELQAKIQGEPPSAKCVFSLGEPRSPALHC